MKARTRALKKAPKEDTTMKINFEKKIWFEAKAKLQSLYNFLTERDFQYAPGEEWKVPERIRKILHMSQVEFYRLTGLSSETRASRKLVDDLH